MCAKDISSLFKKSQVKFTSSDIENEILSIMALMILKEITSEIAGKWYTMVNETTNLSNNEQMVLCLTL